VIDRFHNGEMLHGDTASVHAGPVFHTPAGRLVYGGGGITPDVFVAVDTTQISRNVSALYISGTLNNFIYEYYIHHQIELKKYLSPADFYAGFKNDESLWTDMAVYAKKDSINLSVVSEEDRNQVELRMKALLARLIWRSQGYYFIMNQQDPVLKKAMELLASNNPMPSAVSKH
ncbi:MAG TPA: carboxyl-terminal protease, partial [Puia sp.]